MTAFFRREELTKNTTRLHGIWSAAALMRWILAAAAACAAVVGASAWRSAAAAQAETRVVEISAERFSFTPSQIRVTAGGRLEIRLRSDDTDHGFRILDTDINVIIPKRGKGTATVTLEALKPGRYTFECSKLCGAGHSFMRGVIIVTE
ncbi:MAG TPA: cupredoxin domain-containing protein [Vicinamibacterales bacterium]|nr:cupredoxin domain-containing protein [Vicinamibacterales bacterium]